MRKEEERGRDVVYFLDIAGLAWLMDVWIKLGWITWVGGTWHRVGQLGLLAWRGWVWVEGLNGCM